MGRDESLGHGAIIVIDLMGVYHPKFAINAKGKYRIYLQMNDNWPDHIREEWQDTLATLHMWTQIVGKIRLEQTPLVNHWWNVPLYVSARGLTTSAMPYD